MNIKSFNKICSIVMSILILLILPMRFNINTANASSTRSYYVFNAQNGTRVTARDYTLTALTAPNSNLRGVIGTDDRVIDYSKSGVVKVFCTAYGAATGFVVDDHTVATAGHCAAFSQTSGATISKILLFNSDGTVGLQATPVEIHVPALYFNSSVGGAMSKYDYALITVEEDLSSYNTFYLGATTDAVYSSSMEVSATGFPTQVNNSFVNNDTGTNAMYTGDGTITSTSSNTGLLYFDIDVTNGNSGGPVYRTKQYRNQEYCTVIAIVTTSGATENHGTRITSDLLQFYLHNSNIQY